MCRSGAKARCKEAEAVEALETQARDVHPEWNESVEPATPSIAR